MRQVVMPYHRNQEGIALLLTIFVVALSIIIVVQFAAVVQQDQRSARGYSDGVQAHYILKSAINLGSALVELPKQASATGEAIQEDWLGDPWALIAAAPSLPISSFTGEVRLTIVDASGKLEVNSILESQQQQQQNPFSPFGQQQPGGNLTSDYWKEALRKIFVQRGFTYEQFDSKEYRTPGNIAYDPSQQVAVIQDWIDSDDRSFSTPTFDGVGIESQAPKWQFFNRPLRTQEELLLVPGMTLERYNRIGHLVTVSPGRLAGARRINVNTAPYEVLVALGFPENQAMEIVQQRVNLPIQQSMLTMLTAGNEQLQRHTRVTSDEFIVYARVTTPSAVRWVRAYLRTIGTPARRTATLISAQYY